MEVLGRVQLDIALIYQAAAPAQGISVSVQVIVLQVHKDVFLINFYHPDLHCTQVHGAEGEVEFIFFRQDIAFQGHFYGRFGLFPLEGVREGGLQRVACIALEPGVQREGEVSLGAFIKDGELGTVNLRIAAGGAVQLHHAAEGGIDGNLGKAHLNNPFLQGHLLHAEGPSVVFHQEGVARCGGPAFHQHRVHERGGTLA